MPVDQQVLVDRAEIEVLRGYRALSQGPDEPAWTVSWAEGALDVQPTGVSATVRAEATLALVAARPTATLGLEIPELRPHPMDLGGASFAPEWRLVEVSDTSGAPLKVTLTDEGADAHLAFRADRRLVLVTWPEALPAGAARTLAVRWEQQVPYVGVDALATGSLRRGASTPALPALPTVTGDAGRFPYTLNVAAPSGLQISASGGSVAFERDAQGVRARARGAAGGAALAMVGPWRVDQLGAFRALLDRSSTQSAASMARLSVPLGIWWGEALGGVDLALLRPGWRFPGVVAGEGVVGVRGAVRLVGIWSERDMGVPDLPEIETVLVAEGLAEAAWSALVGRSAQGRGWLSALARASALDLLSPQDALAWRGWLARCVTPLPGARPALSPEAAATTGFQAVAAHCAGPLLVGSMLDDRLGVEGARAARQEAMALGGPSLASLRAGVLRVDPSAGPWVDRWLAQGHPAQLSARLALAQEAGGWRVRGQIRADTELGGAPVMIHLSRGWRVAEAQVQTQGRAGEVDLLLPFRPVQLEVDPERRMLRLPLVDQALESPPQRRDSPTATSAAPSTPCSTSSPTCH